jgi:hypothetical protein
MGYWLFAALLPYCQEIINYTCTDSYVKQNIDLSFSGVSRSEKAIFEPLAV